jgi:type IV fimbrial biogenesis protein FimT
MKKGGATLPELLVSLGIASILLTLAFPGYVSLMNSHRLAVVSNELVLSLQLARSEAVKRGKRVTVCKSSNAMTTAPACDATAPWQSGWITFVDEGSAGVKEPGDTLLHVSPGSAQASIVAVNFSNYGSYLPSGRSQGSSGLPNDTIHVCLAGAKRKIIINNVGRVRMEAAAC